MDIKQFSTPSHPDGDMTLMVVEIVRLENYIASMTKWLQVNQPDVFSRGLWESIFDSSIDAINETKVTYGNK